jgi:hypothetical protein
MTSLCAGHCHIDAKDGLRAKGEFSSSFRQIRNQAFANRFDANSHGSIYHPETIHLVVL